MTLSAPLPLKFGPHPNLRKSGIVTAEGSTRFHEIVTIGQSVSRLVSIEDVYNLLNPINLVVFSKFQRRCLMPKLSQYASYMALAAALFVGFAVTVHVGMQF
jgi:hypothetical protein